MTSRSVQQGGRMISVLTMFFNTARGIVSSSVLGGRMSCLCEQDTVRMTSSWCKRFLVQQGVRTNYLFISSNNSDGRMSSICEHDSTRMSSLLCNRFLFSTRWTYEFS